MIKIEYIPQKRGKNHTYLGIDGIRLQSGIAEIEEEKLKILENIEFFQDLVKTGAIIIHKPKRKTEPLK